MPQPTIKVLDEPVSANTAAVVSIPAPGDKRRIVVDQIHWSYNAQPTDGKLTIAEDGQTCHSLYVTNAGPAVLAKAVEFGDNVAVVVTLAAAGASVKGSISVDYYIRRSAA
jgi:hypothetical protein